MKHTRIVEIHRNRDNIGDETRGSRRDGNECVGSHDECSSRAQRGPLHPAVSGCRIFVL